MVFPFSKVVTFIISVGLCLEGCHASEGSHHDARSKVFSWLSSQPGFYFHDKLSFRQGSIVVEDTVEVNEILMIIPESAILTAEDESKGAFCKLYDVLLEEVELKEASQYSPYVEQIQKEQESDIGLPSMWSSTGQRLLEIVSLTRPSAKMTSVLDDHCIDDDDDAVIATEKDVEGEFGTYKGIKHKNRAIPVVTDDKIEELMLALAVKHQIDEKYFVPLYDQLRHHQIEYNSKHMVLEDGSVQVAATRSITAGEALSRPSMGCLEDCGKFEHANFVEVFKNFGEVQPYPHFWKLEPGMSFVYHGKGEANDKIEWINRSDEEIVDVLKHELAFQRMVYKSEVLPSRETVNTREWTAIESYCQSVISMLEDLIEQSGSSENDSEDDYDDGDDDGEESEDDSEDDGKHEHPKEEEKDDGIDADLDRKTQAMVLDMHKGMERLEKQVQEEGPSPWQAEQSDDEQWAVNGCDLSENCTIYDIWDSRSCGNVDGHNSIRNQTEWVLMRSAYIAVVGPSQASINLTYGSGFKVGYKVGHSPGRGRGVFATEDIQKGTLVWTSEFTAKFTDGVQFRKFLSVLPDDMVCDLILWCYTFADEVKTDLIGCDMDEGSLFNSYDDFYEYTIGHGNSVNESESDKRKFDASAYAMRDIKAGEELVTGYDEFDTNNYKAFGL